MRVICYDKRKNYFIWRGKMRRRKAAFFAAVMVFSLAAETVNGARAVSAAAYKKPGLAKKQVSVSVGKEITVAAKNVTSATKVTVKQGAASKKKVKVSWKAKKKRLFLTGKKKGKCQVKVVFTKKKKKNTALLNVTVKPKNKTPEKTPQATAKTDPDATPGGQPTNSPVPSPTMAGTPTPRPTPTLVPTPKPTYDIDAVSVKDVYKDYFLVGAAINGKDELTMSLHHEGMTQILKKHFNSTTLSNLMKPEHTLDEAASKASADGMPVCKFDTCDEALKFCMQNGIKMRGHTLIWHNQTPMWFFYEDYDINKKPVDAATMEKRMESYIKQMITYCQDNYPGVIYCWDVVNECVCVDKNSYVVTSGGWKLRATTLEDNDFTHDTPISNYWYATMGEKYVEKAFAFARKYADKDVKLFYNDYNVFVTEKMENICMMAEELKAKGLIDGIGLQPTVLMSWPQLDSTNKGSFRVCLETYAELGLELQVTELSFKIDGDVTPQKLEKQSDRYEEFMRLLLEEDSDNGGPCNITSVTVFGICDDYPLYEDFKQNLYLWDTFCDPKLCLHGFLRPGMQLLEERAG